MLRFSVGDVLTAVEHNSVLRQYLVMDVISDNKLTVLPYGDDGILIHRPRTLEGNSLTELCVDKVATRLLARIMNENVRRKSIDVQSTHSHDSRIGYQIQH